MKKLFTALFTLFLFANIYSQEQFSGNWEPLDRSLTKYSKNINILLGDGIIWTYATKLDWINDSANYSDQVFDISDYKLQDNIYEYVTHMDDRILKSVVYNKENDWRIFKTYKLSKNKKKLTATYSGDWTGEVVYQRKK